jgi:hypothetical protein
MAGKSETCRASEWRSHWVSSLGSKWVRNLVSDAHCLHHFGVTIFLSFALSATLLSTERFQLVVTASGHPR